MLDDGNSRVALPRREPGCILGAVRAPESGELQPELAALHALRIHGFLPLDEGAGIGAMPLLVEQGYVETNGRGYFLTAAGDERHQELMAELRRTLDLPALAAPYASFLRVNQLVEDVCVSWQISGRDAEAADAACSELGNVLGELRPTLERLADLAPHLGGYLVRLESALARVREGDTSYLTSPAVDSFHNAWFQLHEDVLLTLGRDRKREEGEQSRPGDVRR